MIKNKVINYINSNSLTGIKAGANRLNFLDIWMVVVEDRIFARSWGLSEKSWYTSFLMNPNGEIKCGSEVFPIKGIVPMEEEGLTEKINAAYLRKYNSEHNIHYAKGIIEPKHVEKTMEFIVLEE